MDKCKTILVWGPKDAIGRSTIAARLGCDLACSKSIVGVIDINRYHSSLPFILNNFNGGGLNDACTVLKESEIIGCFSEARIDFVEGLFFLCMGLNMPIDSLYKFSEENIKKIVMASQSYFDYLIVIIPPNYIETGFVAGFKIDTDNLIVVLDEDLSTFHRYKAYKRLLEGYGIGFSNTTVVLNKTNEIIDKSLIEEIEVSYNSEYIKIPFNIEIKISKNIIGIYRNDTGLSRQDKKINSAFKTLLEKYK